MAEEIQEAVQIIRVAYDGIEIAMKVGSGGIAAMQKAIDFLKGMLDYEKSLGKDVRYVWLHKENVMDIHNGKTMLTFLDTSKDYKLYDEQNRVVTTKKGDELYTHYDKVESSVRERYEKVQKEQKKTTKKKTVTTRKER